LAATVTNTLMTAEELYGPGVPEKFTELVEGELVVMTPAGHRHGGYSYRFAKMFDAFCEKQDDLAFCADNAGFLLRRDPDTVLSPDAALFRQCHLAQHPWVSSSPEVVVEVVPPSNSRLAMTFKRHRYFEAGTQQFWLVDPVERLVQFYFPDGRCITASADETIEGEGIAAGMQIHLPEIFCEK
jgi:Uma2 family endonuclease